jgi:peptidoglycan/xylan/chitin deacetylase (PgdA/CDA1 family)
MLFLLSLQDLLGDLNMYPWNNIQEMQAGHLISFEAHTITHSYLPRMGYNASLKELIDSKNILQQQTGTIVNFMAYPYGAVNATVIRAVQNAGYVGGFGTWAGHVYANSLNMPRVRINGSDSLQTFASKL